MQKPILAAVALTLLTACDAGKDTIRAITNPGAIVLHAGYKVQVDGKPVPIFGNDQCPSANKLIKVLFGPEPDEGQRSCLVVAPETKTVSVLVGSGDNPVHETWVVERECDMTMLRRADGSYVQRLDL